MSTEKYLVNCLEGANNVERATISFILATTASKTCETAIFLMADASRLCTKGGADGLVHEGYEPISDLIKQFAANGGKIWLCPICAKSKGIIEEDLLENAEIAGA
ncbi:MAG: hypothetical protein HN572_03455, partial [Kordiimonadaceae bacterium]|nr:hypothetical protein [Kordiimonadaceae bacterium]